MTVSGRPEVMGMAERVMLPVLVTSELLAVGRAAYLQASRTRGLDLRHRCIGWAHHEYRAGREPNRAFSHRTKNESPRPAAPVRADHDKVRLHIGGELRNRLRGAIGPNVRRQPLEGRRRSVRLVPSLQDLFHMFLQRH